MNEDQNINQLPTGWERKQFSEVAKLIRGVSYDKQFAFNNPDNGLIPLIRATNIQNGLVLEEFVYVPEKIVKEEQLIKEGDILLAMSSGSKELVGKSAQAKQDYKIGFGTFCGLIRANEKINKKYFGYFFQTRNYRNYVSKVSKGIGINNLRRNHIEDLIFPIPSILEQATIVSKIEELFSEVDKGIEEIKAVQQQLKVYRQAVLKWAFEGKLTNPDVEEGELPSNWKVVSIGDIFEVFIGSTPSRTKASYWNGDINWISSGEVAFKNINKTKEKITADGLDKSSCKLHPPGTVIMAMIGEGKTRGQAAILKVEAAHNQNTATIRVPSNYKSEMLYYFLVLKYEENRKIGSGNNQKALNKERVKNIPIPLIPLAEQQQIVQEIESRLSVCDKIEDTITNSLKQAEALRQSILKKAFEGKLI